MNYDDWYRAISGHYFSSRQAGLPVMLSVDRGTLGAISSLPPEEAEASLIAAVRSQLLGNGADMFERIFNRCVAWKKTDRQSPPPSIPLLAISVIAATRMRKRGKITSANYYVPFSELLGVSNSPELHEANEYIAIMWQGLNRWLTGDQKGMRGLETASLEGHQNLTRIGWALSQSLFRESDRQKLTFFFDWIAYDPSEPLDENELLTYFRVWASRVNLSGGAQLMANDPRYERRLKSILTTEATGWDRTLRDERGRQVGRIMLTLAFPGAELGLAAERPTGFPVEATFANEQASFLLHSSFDGWYDSLDLEPSSALLGKGIKLWCNNYLLEYVADDIVPFRQSDELGSWVSVARVVPMEPHWLLVTDSCLPKVEFHLTASSATGWCRASGKVPKGWSLLRDVVFTRPSSSSTSAPLLRIRPAFLERPSFWGGLPISAQKRIYLKGGEPDLWIPNAPEGAEDFPVTLDGRLTRFSPGGGQVELCALDLEAGRHSITSGPTSLEFDTIVSTGVTSSAGSRSLSHFFSPGASGLRPFSTGAIQAPTEPGCVRICGAAISGPELPELLFDSPVLAPVNATRCVVLGATPGQIHGENKPPAPGWLEEAGLYPFGWEVSPPFKAVWVLSQTGDGIRITKLHQSLPPTDDPSPHSAKEVEGWRTFISIFPPPETSSDRPLWDKYQSVKELLQ